MRFNISIAHSGVNLRLTVMIAGLIETLFDYMIFGKKRKVRLL
jgi:hypothetical protein